MLECRLEILLITSKRSPGYCMSLGDTQGSVRRCFSFSFCCVKTIFFCIFFAYYSSYCARCDTSFARKFLVDDKIIAS